MEFRRRSGSTTTATATRISRRSRKAFTTCASRPIRAAGRRLTIFPRCATAASSRKTCPTDCPKACRAWCSIRAARSSADIRVREAILQLFDFEWINRNLLLRPLQAHRQLFRRLRIFRRMASPANARERELLAPFPGAVRADIMDGAWSPPMTDGSGHDRDCSAALSTLFKAAGYELKGTAADAHRDRPSRSPSRSSTTTRDQERARARLCPQSQARRHRRPRAHRRRHPVRAPPHRLRFRHDRVPLGAVAVARQRAIFYWGSAAADQHGSRNYMGVKSKAVDAMIAAMLGATTPREFRRRHPRARPGAAVGLLCGAALFSARAMGGALGANRASLTDVPVRLFAGNLVAERPQALRRWHDPRRDQPGIWHHHDPRRSVSSRRRPSSRRARADRPAEPRRLHRWRAAQPDLRASRPRNLGVAARLRSFGLPTDAVVAMQLPNTVDSIVALLGILRAGMIAAPLPLLWRRRDMVDALSRASARKRS